MINFFHLNEAVNNNTSKKNIIGTITLMINDEGESIPIDSNGQPIEDLSHMASGYYKLNYVKKSSSNGDSNNSDENDSKDGSNNGKDGSSNDSNDSDSGKGGSGKKSDESKDSSINDSMYDDANEEGGDDSVPDFSGAPKSGTLNQAQKKEQASQMAKGSADSANRAQDMNAEGSGTKSDSQQVSASEIEDSMKDIGKTRDKKLASAWNSLLTSFLKRAIDNKRVLNTEREVISSRIEGNITRGKMERLPYFNNVIFAFDNSGSMSVSKWTEVLRSLNSMFVKFKGEFKGEIGEIHFVYWSDFVTVFKSNKGSSSNLNKISHVAGEGYAKVPQGGTNILSLFNMFQRKSPSSKTAPRIKNIRTFNDVSILLIFTDGEFFDSDEDYKKIISMKQIDGIDFKRIGYILTSGSGGHHDKSRIMSFDKTADSDRRIICLDKSEDSKS